MAFYVTTRLHNDSLPPQREAYAPRTVWLLGRPQIGRPMALISAEGHSLVTSRIQRIMHGTTTDSLYVQTHNSLYQLESATVSASPRLAECEGTPCTPP